MNELEVSGVKYRAPTYRCEQFQQTGYRGGGIKKFHFDIEIKLLEFIKETRVPKLDSMGQLMSNRTTRVLFYKEIIKQWYQTWTSSTSMT